jgi:prepilin-type N-terminal cleavage/methylation domain-containing protein
METNKRKTANASKTAGFTIPEVLAVLAIGAAVAAIAITAVVKARQQASYKLPSQLVDNIKGSLQVFTQKTGAMSYPPLTYETATGSIPTSGALLGAASASVVSKAATLDVVFLSEGINDKPTNLDFGGRAINPGGTTTAPLLWNSSTNVFFCNPDAAPTQDFSGMTHIQCALSTSNAPGSDGTNFFLDPSNTALPTGTRVVSLVIPSVTTNDAVNLANYVNNNSTATVTGNTSGAVAYGTPVNGLVTVYYYVASY